MKLVRLYSDGKFKSVTFNLTGLNVILGKVTDKKELTKDTHGLGKSLFGDLLDFMFLKQTKKEDSFITKIERFKNYSFFLEILLDNNYYLLIKRSINSTKVSFRLKKEPLASYDIEISDWTDEDIPFTTAKEVLNDYLAFDVVKNYEYRQFINYFIRHQNDYSDVFHLSKFKGADIYWKKPLFELLGYNGDLLLEKKNKEDTIKKVEQRIEIIKDGAENIGDKDTLLTMIEGKEAELREKVRLADSFEFTNFDNESLANLIDKIDCELQILNSKLYESKSNKKRISDSLQTQYPIIDIEKMRDLFDEMHLLFPDGVYKNFEDLLDFNKKLSEERNGYLRGQLSIIDKEIPQLTAQIETLQNQRAEKLSFLTEENSYEKYKEIQRSLNELQNDISELKRRYDKINEKQIIIEDCNKRIAQTNLEVIELTSEIRKLLAEQKHANIRRIFNDIIFNVLNTNGIISLDLNSAGNIDFYAKIQKPETLDITAKDFSFTYRKFMCMAFDLAILINYSKNSFYKFVYHDGAFEAFDDRKKVSFINLVRQLCEATNLQYIFTIIDSDLPLIENNMKFEFNESEIILTLSDADESGKLFECDF